MAQKRSWKAPVERMILSPGALHGEKPQQDQQQQQQPRAMRGSSVARHAGSLLPAWGTLLLLQLLLLLQAAGGGAAALSFSPCPQQEPKPQQQPHQRLQQHHVVHPRRFAFVSHRLPHDRVSGPLDAALSLRKQWPIHFVEKALRSSHTQKRPVTGVLHIPRSSLMRAPQAALSGLRGALFGRKRIKIHSEEQMDKALARGVPLASMEVCGDLHCHRPPFNPVLLLRLEHLLQQLLSSNGGSSVRSSNAALSELTRWLCGRSEDPGAFKKGGLLLLQQCSTLLRQHVHPVALLLYRRRLFGGGPFEGVPSCGPTAGGPRLWSVQGVGGRPGISRPSSQGTESPVKSPRDGKVLALAIEGGAMRACVCAGMAVGLQHLGFTDSIDAVYGSSAGALIGAFVVSRQLAYEGSAVYTDWLPFLGRRFIDTRRIGRALGLGCLLDGDLRDFLSSRLGRPLVNLDALLVEVLQKRQPFNWWQFERNDKKQPLKVIASGLLSLKSVTLDSSGGNIKDMASLSECLRASMLLPGLTGPVVHLPLWDPPPGGPTRRPLGDFLPMVASSSLPRFAAEAPKAFVTEPLADALLFEAVPYRSAIAQGASHVLVLRSRPDKAPVTRLRGIEAAMEMQMARRFFLRKHSGLRPVYDFMRRRGHREIYMRDMLRLNAATNNLNTLISGRPATVSPKQGGVPAAPASSVGVPTAHALAVAVGGSEKETQKLTAERTAIIRGIRSGFAALWESLQPDPELRNKGAEEAAKVFPDNLPFSPALKGTPLPAPPVYTAEEASALLSPAELAEYFLQSAKAVQDRSSPALSNQPETKPHESPP